MRMNVNWLPNEWTGRMASLILIQSALNLINQFLEMKPNSILELKFV